MIWELDPPGSNGLHGLGGSLLGHEGVAAVGTGDTVVLNSVVQHFLSLDYRLEVLDAAMQHLALGGRLFLGDLRKLVHRSSGCRPPGTRRPLGTGRTPTSGESGPLEPLEAVSRTGEPPLSFARERHWFQTS